MITLYYEHRCGSACAVRGLIVQTNIKPYSGSFAYVQPELRCVYTDAVLLCRGLVNPDDISHITDAISAKISEGLDYVRKLRESEEGV